MSNVWFTSDTHFDHKIILDFCPNRGGTNVEEHNLWVVERLNSKLHKRDTLWILGDISWGADGLRYLSLLNCARIKMILGNHDKLDIQVYMKYGRVYQSMVAYKGMWLTHAPMHPYELRGRTNIHGHVHNSNIPDYRYVNVGIDAKHGLPFSLEEVR